MSTWTEVGLGDLIMGGNDSLWVVEEFDRTSGKVVVSHAISGKRVENVVTLDKPVQIAVRAADRYDLGVAATQVALGGEIIAYTNERGEVMTPPVFVHVGSALGHLYIFHDKVLPVDTSLDAIEATHHAMHERGLSLAHEHVHDPRWADGRGKTGAAARS